MDDSLEIQDSPAAEGDVIGRESARRLKEVLNLRKGELGMSIAEVAELSGVRRATVGRMFNPSDIDYSIPLDKLDAVLSVMGMTLAITIEGPNQIRTTYPLRTDSNPGDQVRRKIVADDVGEFDLAVMTVDERRRWAAESLTSLVLTEGKLLQEEFAPSFGSLAEVAINFGLSSKWLFDPWTRGSVIDLARANSDEEHARGQVLLCSYLFTMRGDARALWRSRQYGTFDDPDLVEWALEGVDRELEARGPVPALRYFLSRRVDGPADFALRGIGVSTATSYLYFRSKINGDVALQPLPMSSRSRHNLVSLGLLKGRGSAGVRDYEEFLFAIYGLAKTMGLEDRADAVEDAVFRWTPGRLTTADLNAARAAGISSTNR